MNHIEECAEVARKTIHKFMTEGSSKDGSNDGWKDKGAFYHLGKGVNHSTLALLIYMGIKPCDGEDHAELALTRFAMACYKLQQR